MVRVRYTYELLLLRIPCTKMIFHKKYQKLLYWFASVNSFQKICLWISKFYFGSQIMRKCSPHPTIMSRFYFNAQTSRGKSLLESWGTTFLPDWLTATLNLSLIYFKITWALPAILLEHMQKKSEINRTKIKGGCQSGRKVVTHNSKSYLPLVQKKKLWGFQWLHRVLWLWLLLKTNMEDFDELI